MSDPEETGLAAELSLVAAVRTMSERAALLAAAQNHIEGMAELLVKTAKGRHLGSVVVVDVEYRTGVELLAPCFHIRAN